MANPLKQKHSITPASNHYFRIERGPQTINCKGSKVFMTLLVAAPEAATFISDHKPVLVTDCAVGICAVLRIVGYHYHRLNAFVKLPEQRHHIQWHFFHI